MGSDSRDVGNARHGRSFVLMVTHLAADRKSAYTMSIHDIYVPIPRHGRNKINAAFFRDSMSPMDQGVAWPLPGRLLSTVVEFYSRRHSSDPAIDET
jgi:hypothetical protein